MKAHECACECCQAHVRNHFEYWQDVANLKKSFEIEQAYTNKLLKVLRWIHVECSSKDVSPPFKLAKILLACGRVLPQFKERLTDD